MGNENYLKLMKYLAYVLEPAEFANAKALAVAAFADVGIAVDESTGARPMTDRATIRAWRELQQAEAETGLMGQDSAARTYRAAIRQMGHDVPLMPLTGMRTAYKLAKSQASRRPRAMAADSKTISDRNERFPHANRLNG